MEQELTKLLNASSPVLVAVVIMPIVWGLKKTPFFPDWMLPFASMAMGAVFYPMLEGWTQKTFIQGIAVGGLSVAFNQQFKQVLIRIGVMKNGDTELIKKGKIPPGIEKLSLIALVVFASGCTVLEVGDARLKSVLNKRSIGDLEYSAKDTNGVTHTLKMNGVKSDQVSGIGAIAEGFARGAVKAALPVPELPKLAIPKIEDEPIP